MPLRDSFRPKLNCKRKILKLINIFFKYLVSDISEVEFDVAKFVTFVIVHVRRVFVCAKILRKA